MASSAAAAEHDSAVDLWTGKGVSLGKSVFPQFHYQAVTGSASRAPADLAVGHHDPDRHGITQQNIEFDVALKLGAHFSALVAYVAKIDSDDHWLDDFEEYYALFDDLPFTAALKIGHFFPRFGYQQELHPHDFVFIDQYLVNGRLIGEDSLTLRGGQISAPVIRSLPPGWEDRLFVAFGSVPVAAEEHEHAGEEFAFAGGNAVFADWALTSNYTLGYAARSDVRYEGGLSFATGRNRTGRDTQLFGAHFDYLWKQGGVLSTGHDWKGGQFLRWRTEVFARRFALNSEHHDHEVADRSHDRDASRTQRKDFTDFGGYTALSYGFSNGKLQAHLRGEYVSGVAQAGLEERWRLSPALTWRPTARGPVTFKLQYNYDYSPSFGDDHSIWVQFNFDWGDKDGHAH